MNMYLPLRAHGPSLTSDQARMLDDEFFRSNPLGHFSSKIANLLGAERTSSHPTAESHPEFFNALGVTESEFLIDFDEQERRVQAAVDALALRHHAAEALTRFTYAVAASTPNGRDARCVWLAIADSPTKMIDALHANVDALNTEGRFLDLFFPPGAVIDHTAIRAADTAIAWLNHAAFLLSDNELSVNAANNKGLFGIKGVGGV